MSEQKEQVLAVALPLLLDDNKALFQGVSFETDKFSQRFAGAVFCDRELAEKDPEWKQIIPYILFGQEGKILCYTRGKGGEARLNAKRSIGIGGHINPVDDFSLEACMLREIREEVEAEGVLRSSLAAIINDDSNEVGRVHIGAVAVFQVKQQTDVTSKDPNIVNPIFLTPEELLLIRDSLEGWSQIVLDNLGAMLQNTH